MHTSELILDSLEQNGWGVGDGLLPESLTESLRLEALLRWEIQQFHPAHVGRATGKARHEDIRGDSISWLSADPTSPSAAALFLTWACEFRQALNERYYLGLTNEEFHFARYPTGSGYAKHLDQHQGRSERKISLVLYLNQNWFAASGGQLVLYDATNPKMKVTEIVPSFGRLVIFRSDLIPHEVLPCFQTRWSLTGWFRNEVQSIL